MKKQIVIIIMFWLIIFLVFCFSQIKNVQVDTFINWHIYLPNIKDEKIIYDTFFGDGDTITILTVGDFNSIEKIIRKNNFQVINTKNIDNINEKIQNFYENLSDDGKSSFTSNLDLDNILNLSKENYYLFKSKNNNRSYIILLLDVNEKVIYSFNSIS